MMNNGETPESTPPARKSKGPGCLVFLAIFFVSWGILSVIFTWTSNSGEKVPGDFMVLIHNKATNKLELVEYRLLDKRIQSLKEKGIAYSFKIPDKKVPLAYDDGDTHYSVTRKPGGEQEISLNYEMGLMNHPTSDYRVVNNTIKPLSRSGGGPGFLLAFFIASIIFLVIHIVRYAFIFIKWIARGTGDGKREQE